MKSKVQFKFPTLKHGDQIPHPLGDSDNQIPSSPGRQRCQMPGVCPGGACWSFDLTDTLGRILERGINFRGNFFRTGCQFGVQGGTYPPKKYPSAPPGTLIQRYISCTFVCLINNLWQTWLHELLWPHHTSLVTQRWNLISLERDKLKELPDVFSFFLGRKIR